MAKETAIGIIIVARVINVFICLTVGCSKMNEYVPTLAVLLSSCLLLDKEKRGRSRESDS